MIEKVKQYKVILLAYCVLFLLILGSVMIEFKLLDVIYLGVLTFFLFRYFYIKSK